MPKVLIVDDDPSLRKIYEEWFRKLGFEVITAKDGFGAVTLALSEHPDAIIVDFALPAKDGLTAAKEIRGTAGTSAIPIVMMTAMVQSPERMAELKSFDGFFPKPFEVQKLVAHVRSLIPLRILIADDGENDRILLKRHLRGIGTIAEAMSCDQAWSILQGSHFDLLITDYNTPGFLNGVMLLALAQTLDNAPRVIVSSSVVDDHFRTIALRLGAAVVIEKTELNNISGSIRALFGLPLPTP